MAMGFIPCRYSVYRCDLLHRWIPSEYPSNEWRIARALLHSLGPWDPSSGSKRHYCFLPRNILPYGPIQMLNELAPRAGGVEIFRRHPR